MKILIFFILVLAAFASPLGERAADREVPNPRSEGKLHPIDQELLLLTGAGRFQEAYALGREHIDSDCRSCLPYFLTVKAAAQIGKLDQLADELQTKLRTSLLDTYLLAGNAFALWEMRQEQQALQLLALAVRNGVDCPLVYKTFVELSHMLETARETEFLIEQLLSVRPHDGNLLFARAYFWTRWGDASRATFAFQEAMIKARPSPMTYYFYAVLLANSAEYERALSVCRTGLRVTSEASLPEMRVALMNVLSSVLELSGNEAESLEVWEEALGLARKYNLTSMETHILTQRSLLMGSRGRSDLGLQYLDQATTYRDRLYFPEDKGRYLIQLGFAFRGAGKPEPAESAFREAVELAQSVHDPFLELEGRINLGFIHLIQGDREAARDIFALAVEEAAQIQSEILHGRALSGLATTLEQVGNYQDALETYREAWLSARKTGELRSETLALSNMALVYFRSGRLQEALLHAVRANQLAQTTLDFRLQMGVQQGFAAVLAGLRNFRESQKVYQAALDISTRFSSPTLQALLWSGWARVTLELGENERARQGFEQALSLARSMGNGLVAVQALAGLGLSYQRQGKHQEASRHFEEALALIESTRRSILSNTDRMSYLETRTQVFSNLIAVLMELDEAEPERNHRARAFEVVERSRSRSLLDLLVGAQQSGAIGPNRIGSGQPATSLELQRHGLGNGDLYLEYSLGERKSFLFVFSRDESRVVHLPPREDIELPVRRFLGAVASPPRSPGNPFERHLTLGREVFDAILGPVRDLVAESRHVIISPDGILHYLPFGALVTEETSSHRYLMEQVTLSYVPSAGVLLELSRRPGTRKRSMEFLGVAQPRAFSETLSVPQQGVSSGAIEMPHIPFAIDEVEAIAGLFPVEKSRVYSDRLATEQAVKSENLRRFRILHFATHALANGVEPEQSAIYLATDSTTEDDGALRMAEILGLSLASDLVVLSGCQTGLGQLLRAEGIVGLPWAFISAGSSAVVVSLWNVNDRSTADLMQFFHQNLQQGDDRATALVDAQKVMLASERRAYRHPFYWAPFVLVGLSN